MNNFKPLDYSLRMEAVKKDEDTHEMVCNLLTGYHVYQVKIPLPQFEELKKDGYFTLIDAKLSTKTFIDAPGYIKEPQL